MANDDPFDPVGEDSYPVGEFTVVSVDLPWIRLEGFTGRHLASRFKKVGANLV